MVTRDGPRDPIFQLFDQAVETVLQLGVDTLKHRGGAQFLMRAELGPQPFAHLDQLGSLQQVPHGVVKQARTRSMPRYMVCAAPPTVFAQPKGSSIFFRRSQDAG
jgi:hypothetical protein